YGRFKFLTKFGAMEGNHLKESNISYLRARDPSILTFNRHHLSEVRTNLHEEFCNDNHQQEQEHKIRVFLRIKNGYDFNDLYEVEGDKRQGNSNWEEL
ncbi:unnamed protein product, partial [Tenebrio molitor]